MKKNYALSFNKIIFTFLLTLTSLAMWGQVTLANYKFENNLTVETGAIGSPNLTASTAVTYFGGVTGNAVSYATSTGKYFDIIISTAGYSSIDISFAGRSSQTNSTWIVTGDSSGGTTFSAISSLTCPNGSFASLPTTLLGTSYDNKSSIRIRITAGGTSATLRLDDLLIRGIAPTGKTITFNNNGGTGTMANQTASTATNLTANTFTRTGYNFANWNTAADASGTSYANSASYPFTADADMYAQWSINQYSVTYNGNSNDGGSAPATQTENYNTSITLNTNSGSLTRTGYTFNGWNTATNGTGTHYAVGASFTIPASNTPLYAEWVSTAPSLTYTGTLSALSTTYGTASSNTTTSLSGINLPANVTVNAPTGFEISTSSGSGFGSSLNLPITAGTLAATTIYVRLAATTSVGTYNGNVSASSGATSANASIPNSTVTAKGLTITGLTALPKIYDGTTSATLSGTATLNGVVGSDDVTLTGTATGTFVDKNVGTGKAITVTGYTLSGTKAGNYTVSQPTGLTANITAKALTVTGATAQNKVYDGTTAATITGATLVGVISPDAVTVSGGGTFADANAGTGKPVTANLSIGGADVANYTLTQPTGLSADITKANPVFTTSTINLTIGGTYVLPGAITSTSNGTLSYSMTDNAAATLTGGNTINGIAVGTNTLTVNQAASTNYNAGSTTVAVNVSTVVYTDGDFMTKTGGIWTNNASGTVTWYKRVGGNWTDTTEIPNGTADSYIVFITENVEVPAAGVNQLSTSKIHILNNATLTYSNTSNQWTFRNIVVDSGASLLLKARFTMLGAGEFEVKDGGNFIFDYGSNGNSFSTGTGYYLAGKEKFHPNSNFILKNTDAGSFLTATGIGAITPNSANSYFGNLIIDYSAGENALHIIDDTGTYSTALFQKALCNNLIFRTSNGQSARIYQVSGTTSYIGSTNKLTILGNFITEATYTGAISFTTASQTAGSYYLRVNGNFIHNAPIIYYGLNAVNGVTYYLEVGKNVEIGNGAKYYFRPANNATAGMNLYIAGNLKVDTTGELADLGTNAAAGSNVWFNGTTPQTIDFKNQNSNAKVLYSIRTGTDVSLINQDLALGTSSAFTVKTGSTFNFGFSGATALNLVRVSGQTLQAFTAETNSTLKITSPLGITSGATPDYTGNVQIGATAATRVFNAGATYHYIGKSATPQVTGNGIATAAAPLTTGKIIVDMETAAGQFAASASKTINTPGVLEIKTGVVTDDSTNGFIGTGNLTMNSANGRYITSKTGLQPDLSGTYALTNGVVEFANTSSSATIRVTPEYYNVDISGTDIQPGGKNFVVNNLLKVTKASAVLTIPEEIDTANPYVVTAKKGIQIIAGKAIFKNNANLMQDETGANNTGNIIAERNVYALNNNLATQMDYVYWSSPVVGDGTTTGQILRGTTGFSSGTPSNRFFEYKESNDTFFSTPDATFKTGKGYAIRAEDGLSNPYAKTYSFTGVPSNGIFNSTQNLVKSTAGAGYNLVGNPYPSTINLDQLFTLNTDRIYPVAFMWTNAGYTPTQMGSGYNLNNYAVYNRTGGDPATAYTLGFNVTNATIKIGQGFIVQAKTVGNGLPLKFDHSIRNPTTGTFYEKEGSAKDRYWVQLISPAQIVNTMLVGYFDNATAGFDEDYDAELFSAPSDVIYSMLNNQKLLIQGKNIFNIDDKVLLGSKQNTIGNYTIKLAHKEGVFENGQAIYLHDKVNNTYTNLQETDFTYSAQAGATENRFEIVYEAGAVLATGGNTKESLQVYRNGENFVVKSNQDKIDKVEVYDASGRLFQQVKGGSTEVTIAAATLSSGMYILKILRNNETITKKILK